VPNHRIIRAFAVFAIVTLALAIPAAAYDYPSTNDANRTAGLPHVNVVSSGVGEVTLDFVNDTNSLAFFEYRIDGVVVSSGTPHPVVIGEYIYPGVSVDSRNIATPVVVTRTLAAAETVEVRLALGGERDWDFNWVTFEALADAASHEDCADGGWEAYGFANQGQCVRFVNGGGDSRP
jgi:hypothetical protein